MTHAYSRTYLADAEDCLANAFDYAVHDCKISGDIFANVFAQSEFGRQFEVGSPAVVAGLSGLDLACKVLARYGLLDEEPQATYTRGQSPEYWAGWVLAQYQWERACRFTDIFARVPYSRVVDLYHPLHEADISVFIDSFDGMLAEGAPAQTNLARLRKLRGFSQAGLAEASGVGVKSIQAYEQRTNSINRASGRALRSLAMALGCPLESLLEFEPQVAVEYRART